MNTIRRKYDKEFKLMAVNLLESGKSTRQVADDLGVAQDLVCRWRREIQGSPLACFSGNGNANITEEQKEILALKKALREAQLESEILKKAVSIFSKSDGKYLNLNIPRCSASVHVFLSTHNYTNKTLCFSIYSKRRGHTSMLASGFLIL